MLPRYSWQFFYKDMLIKANINDKPTVLEIYGEVWDNDDNSRFSNWSRGDYPTENIVDNAISCGSLFLYYENSVLKGSVILDTVQPKDYDKIDWQYNKDGNNILVIHTLCIRPQFARQGSGKKLFSDIENYARSTGYSALRFDTYYKNAPAKKIYNDAGCRTAGINEIYVYKKKRLLICFEKRL